MNEETGTGGSGSEQEQEAPPTEQEPAPEETTEAEKTTETTEETTETTEPTEPTINAAPENLGKVDDRTIQHMTREEREELGIDAPAVDPLNEQGGALGIAAEVDTETGEQREPSVPVDPLAERGPAAPTRAHREHEASVAASHGESAPGGSTGDSD